MSLKDKVETVGLGFLKNKFYINFWIKKIKNNN